MDGIGELSAGLIGGGAGDDPLETGVETAISGDEEVSSVVGATPS